MLSDYRGLEFLWETPAKSYETAEALAILIARRRWVEARCIDSRADLEFIAMVYGGRAIR